MSIFQAGSRTAFIAILQNSAKMELFSSVLSKRAGILFKHNE